MCTMDTSPLFFLKRWDNKGLQEYQQVISNGDTNVMFSAFLTFTQLL